MVSIKFFVLLASIPLILYLWPSGLAGDTEYIIIYGNSMLPTFPHGSLAIAKKAPDYQIGDIISFKDRYYDRIIVHRIVDDTERGFVTLGDNNIAPDDIVTRDRILGKVMFVAPYLGFPAILLKNPLVLTIFMVSVLGIMGSKKGKKGKEQGEKEKVKVKPVKKGEEYALFLPAMFANLVFYVVLQMSVSGGKIPATDPFTGLLFTLFEPFVASTLAFASWHFAIFGAYFIANNYQQKQTTLQTGSQSGWLQVQIRTKETRVLQLAQVFWLVFITIQMINIVRIIGEFATGISV